MRTSKLQQAIATLQSYGYSLKANWINTGTNLRTRIYYIQADHDANWLRLGTMNDVKRFASYLDYAEHVSGSATELQQLAYQFCFPCAN